MSRLSRLQTGEAFLFMLIVSLVEKVQQCDDETSYPGYNADGCQNSHKYFILGHSHHLPSYGFRQAGALAREATTPSWVLFHTVARAPIDYHFPISFSMYYCVFFTLYELAHCVQSTLTMS